MKFARLKFAGRSIFPMGLITGDERTGFTSTAPGFDAPQVHHNNLPRL
jgi:hypothetical protein